MGKEYDEEPFSRYGYMVAKAVLGGAEFFHAMEAVASTALEHPEWDMEERKTWEEWEAADEKVR